MLTIITEITVLLFFVNYAYLGIRELIDAQMKVQIAKIYPANPDFGIDMSAPDNRDVKSKKTFFFSLMLFCMTVCNVLLNMFGTKKLIKKLSVRNALLINPFCGLLCAVVFVGTDFFETFEGSNEFRNYSGERVKLKTEVPWNMKTQSGDATRIVHRPHVVEYQDVHNIVPGGPSEKSVFVYDWESHLNANTVPLSDARKVVTASKPKNYDKGGNMGLIGTRFSSSRKSEQVPEATSVSTCEEACRERLYSGCEYFVFVNDVSKIRKRSTDGARAVEEVSQCALIYERSVASDETDMEQNETKWSPARGKSDKRVKPKGFFPVASMVNSDTPPFSLFHFKSPHSFSAIIDELGKHVPSHLLIILTGSKSSERAGIKHKFKNTNAPTTVFISDAELDSILNVGQSKGPVSRTNDKTRIKALKSICENNSINITYGQQKLLSPMARYIIVAIAYTIWVAMNYAVNTVLINVLYMRTAAAVKVKAKSWANSFGSNLVKAIALGVNMLQYEAFDWKITTGYFGVWIFFWILSVFAIGKEYARLEKRDEYVGVKRE